MPRSLEFDIEELLMLHHAMLSRVVLCESNYEITKNSDGGHLVELLKAELEQAKELLKKIDLALGL